MSERADEISKLGSILRVCTCRGAGIGRQAGLRIQCPKGHESSSLSRGTRTHLHAVLVMYVGGEFPSTY